MIHTKIKTYEDACVLLKRNPKALPDVTMLPYNLQKFTLAAIKLATIAEALNDGWVPDWNHFGQWKYYPWFNMDDASGFSFNDYAYGRTHSDLGSRLCFKSEAIAKYAGKQFIDLYRDFLTLEK